ncbi:YetF domain-containing protein [Bacillus xiapuensis]|uniref:YetF domain-containing protein n=1 Tax=Bacillus xiapuensis TaxID=2014075 RepID=UPI003AF31C2B
MEELAIYPKSEADQPTQQDLNIKVSRVSIPITIISDGAVNKNFKKAGVNEDWLHQQLKNNGVHKPNGISYREYKPGKIYSCKNINNVKVIACTQRCMNFPHYVPIKVCQHSPQAG